MHQAPPPPPLLNQDQKEIGIPRGDGQPVKRVHEHAQRVPAKPLTHSPPLSITKKGNACSTSRSKGIRATGQSKRSHIFGSLLECNIPRPARCNKGTPRHLVRLAMAINLHRLRSRSTQSVSTAFCLFLCRIVKEKHILNLRSLFSTLMHGCYPSICIGYVPSLRLITVMA